MTKTEFFKETRLKFSKMSKDEKEKAMEKIINMENITAKTWLYEYVFKRLADKYTLLLGYYEFTKPLKLD